MPQYKVFNGPLPTTAAQLAVTTGTSIKTMLQVKGVTAVKFKIKAWGYSFDGAAAAAGIQAEILETGTIFGTVTASVAADILPVNVYHLLCRGYDFYRLHLHERG